MESATETVVIERELTLEASPETVWEFLVDPDKTMTWWGVNVTFDPRPGGIFRNEVIPGHVASGEFVEVDRPRRLVYTWGWEVAEHKVPPGSTTVEIELIPEGDGTRLRFEHRDLPGAQAADSHSHGWDHYLERLAVVANGGDPGPDPWVKGEMT
jgi:uncharacterized protein YndB with AHSA1/START domain